MHFSHLLRILPLAALGVALAGGVPAEASATSAPAATLDAPFLWRIDGGDKPSYLFGTIHAGVGASELSPLVGDAIESSDLFVMETAPANFLTTRFPSEVPMDIELARSAHRGGTPVATLESMKFQLSLLAQLGSTEELAAMLADDSSAIEPLVDAYRGGELATIEAVTDMGDAGFSDLSLIHI